MNQSERRVYLLRALLGELPPAQRPPLPQGAREQCDLLRALMNLRPSHPVSASFLDVQDAYLQAEIDARGIVDCATLTPVRKGLYLWQGNITALKADAIVNAANSGMTGCYHPLHGCIDNCIHSFSGVQLRLFCNAMMRAQGHAEPTGNAKITPAFNLPSRYILHTVGPIVRGGVTAEDERLLASCYRACLDLATQSGCKNVAFCCISTGEFHFPNRRAAEIAVQAVSRYRETSDIEVIFNVYRDIDADIYRALLNA